MDANASMSMQIILELISPNFPIRFHCVGAQVVRMHVIYYISRSKFESFRCILSLEKNYARNDREHDIR